MLVLLVVVCLLKICINRAEQQNMRNMYCTLSKICQQNIAYILPEQQTLWHIIKPQPDYSNICTSISAFNYSRPVVTFCQKPPPSRNLAKRKSSFPVGDTQVLFAAPIPKDSKKRTHKYDTLEVNRVYQVRYQSFYNKEDKIENSFDNHRTEYEHHEVYTMEYPFSKLFDMNPDLLKQKQDLREMPILSPQYGSITSLAPAIYFHNVHSFPESIDRLDISIIGILDSVSVQVKGNSPTHVALRVDGIPVEPSSWFITVVPILSFPNRTLEEQINKKNQGNLNHKFIEGSSDNTKKSDPADPPKRRKLIEFATDVNFDGDVDTISALANANKDKRGKKSSRASKLSSPQKMITTPGIPSYLYLELVLTDKEIQKERRFVPGRSSFSIEENLKYDVNNYSLLPESFVGDLKDHYKAKKYIGSSKGPAKVTSFKEYNPNSLPQKRPGRSRVCISSNLKMDGQRRIWIDQLKYFAELAKDRPDFSFEFVYLFTTAEDDQLEDNQVFNPQWFDEIAQDPSRALFYMKSIKDLLLMRTPQMSLNSRWFGQKVKVIESALYSPDYNKPAKEFIEGQEDNVTRLFDYMHHRFLLAKKRIDPDHLSPRWVYNLYQSFFEFWTFVDCDMIVAGNPRGLSADVLLTDIASIMHVPTLSELLNLYPHSFQTPDIIIAPSHYALEHESTRDVLASKTEPSKHGKDFVGALGVVIPPSVDMKTFDPQRFNQALYRHYREEVHLMRTYDHQHPEKHFYPIVPVQPETNAAAEDTEDDDDDGNKYLRHSIQIRRPRHCPAIDYFVNETDNYFELMDEHHVWKHFPCVLIGFVGRLHPSKNPGLFLQMAYHLHQRYPFVRFRILGDGPLRGELEHLTNRLELQEVVEFVGWVSIEQLPHELVQLDMVVNPSLRAWSETFCIANVEVLSVGVPLITFGVGGIGEYVQEPSVNSSVLMTTAYPDKNKKSQPTKRKQLKRNKGSQASLLAQEEEAKEGNVQTDAAPKRWTITENALLLDTADPEICAEAVYRELLQNPRQAQHLGRQGRASVVQYFTPERQMLQYEQLYRAVHIQRYGKQKKLLQ